MSAKLTNPPADYQAEANSLVKWLFEQADLTRKHAPDRRFVIAKLEDSASLIDSYRAGLVLTNPHPLMCAELVRWVSTDDARPCHGEMVLLWAPGDEGPWMGYFDGEGWRSHGDIPGGLPYPSTSVTHWASMPTGPATGQSVEAPREEPAA